MVHRKRIGWAALALAAGFQAVTSHAAPWIDAGDPRLRFQLQQLADRGQLQRSVTTWPLMWDTVQGGVNGNLSDHPPLHTQHHARTASGLSGRVTVGAVTEAAFLRGFQHQPREQGELAVAVEWQNEWLAVGLQPTLAADPQDDEALRLDGSYLALNLSNWQVGAGAIDRWWGPGWQSSLVLSSNARPVPAVWLNRRDARASDWPLLNWLGPWQLTALVGQLEDERHIPEAKFFGMRVTFRPLQGLDIGLSRTFQIGGEGRSESASTFVDAFFGRDNPEDNASDPSNQLGAVDVRYGFAMAGSTMGIYLQMMGEDEAGGFPSRKSWLLGVDWTSQLNGHAQQWFVEGADTMADHLFGSGRPDLTYEHRVYRSGYRHRGRNMASTFEGDSQAVAAGVYNFLPDGRYLGMVLSWMDLRGKTPDRVANPDPDIQYYVPGADQTLVVLAASYHQPLPLGTLELTAQLSDDKLILIGEERDQWSLGASWQYTF